MCEKEKKRKEVHYSDYLKEEQAAVIWEFAYSVPCSEPYWLYVCNVTLWHVRIFLAINSYGHKYCKCCHGNVTVISPVLVYCICCCQQYKVLKVLLYAVLSSNFFEANHFLYDILFGHPIFLNISFCFISLFFLNTCLGVHVKCPVFVYNFNKAWILLIDFNRSLQYQISCTSVHLERSGCTHLGRQMVGWTDRTNTVGASCKFTKASNEALYVGITSDLTVVSPDFV